MPAVVYRLINVNNGEILEGITSELSIKLNITPAAILKAYKEDRIVKKIYRVEKTENKVPVPKKRIDDDILEEWDEVMSAIRKKYGKKRA